MKCKCDFRTFMVGDGCDVCNPAKALEYARETIDEQAALIEEMGEALKIGEITTPDFLDWVADRFIHVYGENPNMDFIHCLRSRSAAGRIALAKWKESK